jgi:hypothetical protein
MQQLQSSQPSQKTLVIVEKMFHDTYFHDYLVSIRKTFPHFQIVPIPFQMFANPNVIDHLFVNPIIANIIWVQRCPISPELAMNYKMKYPHIRWYILNMEQLTSAKHSDYLRNQINNSQNSYLDGIIDYQYANKSFFQKKNRETSLPQSPQSPNREIPYYIIPYQLHDDEYFDQDKIYDCAIVGINSERRRVIYSQLQRAGVRVLNIEGWGVIRDNLLFRCKILVNVHHNEEYNIYETIRCDRCTWNKMIVVSETSYHGHDNDQKEDENSLEKYTIECPYNNIVEMVSHVLQNYDVMYEHIFTGNRFEEEKRRIQQGRREINFT